MADEAANDGTATPKKPKSPEVLKSLRSSAKRAFTKLVNSIDSKIDQKCTHDAILLLRENLEDLMNQCLHYHTKYVESAKLDAQKMAAADEWAIQVDQVARENYKKLDDYIALLATQGNSSSSLTDAKQKRIEAEQALLASERETEEKIAMMRREADIKRKTLEAEIQKKKLEESILAGGQLPIPSPPPPSEDHPNFWASTPIGPTNRNVTFDFSNPARLPASAPNWLSTLLPKIQLPTFTGDPRLWRSFSRSFKELVHDAVPSDAQRIVVLREMLAPDVRHGLEQMLRNPSNYSRVLKELHNKYGDPYLISRAYLHGLQRIRSCRDGDYKSLKDFAAQLHDAVCGLVDEGCNELCSGSSLELMIEKLPNELKSKWGMFAFRKRPAVVTLVDLDAWLQERIIGEIWARPAIELGTPRNPSRRNDTPSVLSMTQQKFPSDSPGSSRSDSSNGKQENQRLQTPPNCVFCGALGHPLHECGSFVSAPPDERMRMVMKGRNCFRCLGRQHTSSECKKEVVCTIQNCGRKHHPLLHGSSMPGDTIKRRAEAPLTGANAEKRACMVTRTLFKQRKKVLLPIIEITIQAGDRYVKALALLDSGSQVTLIHRDLAECLHLEGEEYQISFSTFHGEDPVFTVREVCFDIITEDGQSLKVEGGFEVPNLNIGNPGIDWQKEKANWNHLSDLDLSSTTSRRVLVLIGVDIAEAHVVTETRIPPIGSKGPIAIKTPLGWTTIGSLPSAQSLNGGRYCCTQSLDDLLQRLFEIDTRPKPLPPVKGYICAEDRRAMDILVNTTRNVGGRYEVGMLWARENFVIPDNRPAALQRLFSNERRFEKDPTYAARYSQIMNEYVEMGFARKLKVSELNGPEGQTNYLVHFGVVNPNKPEKLRVVFHAALKYKGVSLNDLLLPGPDLLTSLVGVLIRFRTSLIGVSGDIEKMFMQVAVRQQDQSMLRYVWREPGSNMPPSTYQMQVHVFGATSSPCCCAWALKSAAMDQPEYDLVETINENFYVDNYLDSFDSENEAIDKTKALIEMLARRGFRLNQWSSSSREVLNSIPATERSHSHLNIDLDCLPIERTLGMRWHCETDSFSFIFKKPKQVACKREMFSAVASIFDPLGCIAPVILTAKILMQEIWRQGISWDDPLPEQILREWQNWCASIEGLEKIGIPRCLRPKAFCSDQTRIQLHVFSDASKNGYGAVGYLRYVNDFSIHVAFILAKSRVAPVRQLTIPKLELNGAWTAIEVARTILKDFKQKIPEVFYWTDSSTVLHWIRSTRATRLPEFVANRVSHILDHSKPEQWMHVPGLLNPADDGSRGLKSSCLLGPHRWLDGPAFLLGPLELWPDQNAWPTSDGSFPMNDEGLSVNVTVADEKSEVEALIENASSLEDLKSAVVNLRDKEKHGPLQSVQDLKMAMSECVRSAQASHFGDEIRCLMSSRGISKKSFIRSLNPYLDEKGLLRVGGRLEHADLAPETKHPLIIPHQHRLAKLIIVSAHEAVRHGGKVRTLCESRAKFWITRGLATVKKCIRECLVCRKKAATSTQPLMAPLPAHRLQPYLPPFTNVGIDYFGPFLVVVGRRQEKRYGALFTCLTTRAVHLELAHHLTCDSFILAFRRFVDRRGSPSVVFSDNGTNLTSGEKEMREAVQKINSGLQDYLKRKEIEWRFSPPSAPHFGGIWERLVRSCKSALEHVLNGRSVSDEVLYTAFTEIESLLNGRPLTHVSVDSEDPYPLTPNHFLLGRPNPNLPIAIVSPNERLSSKKWRLAQQIVDHFWRRWLQEYVPNLTERKKWTTMERPLQLNDLVLIADKGSERGSWPVGRVTKVMPGPDGIIRTAVVKTANGEYTRPAIKLFIFQETKSELPPQ